MKKVLLLTSAASMIDRFLMPSLYLLQDLGFEVVVATNFESVNASSTKRIAEFAAELDAQGIPRRQIGVSRRIMDIGANLKAYRQIKALLEADHYEFIHCHSPIAGAFGRIAGRKTRTPVIYTAHGFHFYKGAPVKNWLLYYPAEKILAHYTDCLITINHEDYQIALKKKFKAKKIEFTNGAGINLGKFTPQTHEIRQAARERYGYSLDDFIMVSIGEMNANKHQDMAIRAAARLKDRMPNLKFLLVGRGDRQDEYQRLSQSLGLEGVAEFVGYRSDIEEWIQIADLLVSTSRREGLPFNVLEAMAIGLPAIVTDCRGNRDVVQNGENGYVISMDDECGFADAIEKIFRSAEIRERFRSNNLRDVRNYSQENILQEMKRIYMEMSR